MNQTDADLFKKKQPCTRSIKNKATCMETLQAYKNLADNPDNHNQLIKDKTVLFFIATLLDGKDNELLPLCLDILKKFVENEANHHAILHTFGLYESLSQLAINTRGKSDNVSARVTSMLEKLRATNSPRDVPTAYESKTKFCFVYNLLFPDLSQHSRKEYERVLLSTKGIVSFVLDDEKKTCLVRLHNKVTIIGVVDVLKKRLNTLPMLIVRNKFGDNDYIDVCEKKTISFNEPCLEYKEKFPGLNASFAYFTGPLIKTKDAVMNLVNTWNDSFYW